MVAGKGDLVADMHPGEVGLGDEEANEDVLRRQERDDRRAGGERLAGKGDHIGDEARARRGDRPLVETPLCLFQRRLQRIDERLLGFDLGGPTHRRLCGREGRAGRRDLGLRRAQRRLLLVDGLLGRRARFQERGAAPQILLRPVARSLRVA